MSAASRPAAAAEPIPAEQVAPITAIRQGYGLDRIYRWCQYKLRVDIERNAYDFQSHYRVSVWGGPGSGWQLVAVVAPQDPQAVELPSYVCWGMGPARQQGCVEAVEAMVDRLLVLAQEVLT